MELGQTLQCLQKKQKKKHPKYPKKGLRRFMNPCQNNHGPSYRN